MLGSIRSRVCVTLCFQHTFCLIFKKAIDLGGGAVEDDDGEAMIGNVHDQVLTHDGQADQAEITTMVDPRRSADIDAGKTGATVSPLNLSEMPAVARLVDKMKQENNMHDLIEVIKHHGDKRGKSGSSVGGI